MPQFIATCAKGLEYLLVDELTQLGMDNPKEGLSQVVFEADWTGAYRALMWSRVASRVFYPIARFDAKDEAELYRQCSIIDWSQHMDPDSTFVVNAQTFRSDLSHSRFIAQRIKDAVVDYFREEGEQRPDVEFEQPDVSIHCRIRRNQAVLSIDLAGVGLHQRAYRIQGGSAPIKENLASALLMRAGWPTKEGVIFDPMCGSGTFLIEAAWQAFDIAPGIQRDFLGVFGWKQFQPTLWDEIVKEAEERRTEGLKKDGITIIGSDINPKAVRNAQMNIALAGMEEHIKVHIGGLDQVEQLSLPESGLLMVNPPYSERLGEREEVERLYRDLGDLLKTEFVGWHASVLSADKDFGHALGIRAQKIYKFNNGSIACELLNLSIQSEHFLKQRRTDVFNPDYAANLSPQAEQLNNRLLKNRAKLKKYLARENISCYRIYDADLPEYNAAIDVYGTYLHIQEYRAPRSVDEATANRHIKELQRVAAGVFELPLDQVHLKQRQKQKGDWQYQTQREFGQQQADKNFMQVTESGRKFWVNLEDYLDTGLFLDHRMTRQKVAELAKGKRLLNLFCYTASVSVYAATAGAVSTTNVDLSRTYLDWAKRNFKLNGLNLEQHEFIRDNCVTWLSEQLDSPRVYDVIFLDPPTFSNSKKMQSDFDVQVAHPQLIEHCVELLAPGGKLFFSNNYQKFEMQYEPGQNVRIQEITHKTLTPDFSRKGLHRCWLIEKQAD